LGNKHFLDVGKILPTKEIVQKNTTQMKKKMKLNDSNLSIQIQTHLIGG